MKHKTKEMNTEKEQKTTALLGYELTSHQNVWINHFTPSIVAFLLYSLLIASDIAVVYRHYRDENPIWASLTISFMYAPVVGCYIVTVSSWDLWPKRVGYGMENVIWFIVKTLEHLLFPLWSVWRYAERIFWSIEAIRSTDGKEIAEAIAIITAPRTVELYLFFQAYLHSLPQILLQLHVLMLTTTQFEKETVDAQILSLVFNLCKVSATTTFYQRFKSQKLAGKQYPWFKAYKREYDPSIDIIDGVQIRTNLLKTENQVLDESAIVTEVNKQKSTNSDTESRRSSDFYLEPTTSFHEENKLSETTRETSVVDGPQRQIFRDPGITEPDFSIRRLIYIKGLPDDDLAGKIVAFCWWFCFLFARILALTSFAYFYRTQVLWLILSHFIIVEAFLIYDVKSDEVKRAKAIFFGFLGFIYLFCIIEFKIKFKKTKFIYYGFFTLVYTENFIMCLIWWFGNIHLMESDFWFRYAFAVIVMCSIISLTAMLLYLNVNKPEKVVIGSYAK